MVFVLEAVQLTYMKTILLLYKLVEINIVLPQIVLVNVVYEYTIGITDVKIENHSTVLKSKIGSPLL